MASQLTGAIYTLTLFAPVLVTALIRDWSLFAIFSNRRKWKSPKEPGWEYSLNQVPRNGRTRHSSFELFMHKLAFYQYAPVPYINDMGLGELLMLSLYCILNLIFLLTPIPLTADTAAYVGDPGELSVRAGWVAAGNAFFILASATRNSILEYLTGIPFERMIMYHRWCGRMIFVLITLHAAIQYQQWDSTGVLSTLVLNFQDPNFFYATLGFVFLVILMAMSHSVIRRRVFNWFYFSHFTFIGFMIFGGLHSLYFTKFAAAGMVLYLIDRAVRLLRSRTPCKTISVQTFPNSAITRIVLEPKRLNYHPGQYLFMNVPSVATFGFYPFSISSAPDLLGEDNRITLHIKDAGDWTQGLLDEVKDAEMHARGGRQNGREPDPMVAYSAAQNVKVWVDGAYGRTGIEFAEHEVAVFVCGGIGVTPMLSMLLGLLQRLELTLPTVTSDLYFIWLVRDFATYTAFSQELLDVRRRAARLPSHVRISLQVFVTRGGPEVQRELDALTPTEAELIMVYRPDARDILRDLKSRHPDKDVGVGVCGPKNLVRTVRNACVECSDESGLWYTHWETFKF